MQRYSYKPVLFRERSTKPHVSRPKFESSRTVTPPAEPFYIVIADRVCHATWIPDPKP